ncbi:hypothetical protein EG327_009515 [Venturia inaequalis]|uniref:C2H2-type domain-containing protein n=1 Tax=Venturia inaequalis TaxID=5025 RepID=A0A8H3UPE8_VENIN|nr:hypothetical protein EG327_009515 [Venturia inaequalis]
MAMGLELPSKASGSQPDLAREDADAVRRLRQNYPPHILASLFEKGYITSPRVSLSSSKSRPSDIPMSRKASEASSFTYTGTASTRSSISISPSNKRHHLNSSASYTSLIPSISESSEIPQMYKSRNAANRSKVLTRSISEYALRDHALGLQSFPRQELFVSTPVYFCVHCGNGFEKRGDWETHEWIFHERQSYWPCPESGCEVVFDAGKSFEAHHEVMHGCGGCKHSAECVRLLPERKVWACGFDGCKAVFLDWSKRCKHVASHYEGLSRRVGNVKETPSWKYSTTVRNLLRQPDTREHFKKFMIKCHGHSKTGWPTLDWQSDTSAELKRCLEYRDFPNGVGEVVYQAYRLGHPANTSAVQVRSRPPTPPVEDLNHANLSRIEAYFGFTGPGSARLQRSHLYERKNLGSGSGAHLVSYDNHMYPSVISLPSSPPSASPTRTRNRSKERAGSLASDTASLAPSLRIGRKRLVAREAEVRNTSCSALASFLKDGPVGVSDDRQPRRAIRAPRIPPPVAPSRPPLVAREAEVRHTRNSTLISILREGPPEVADHGGSYEQKISRSQSIPCLPSIRVESSPFLDYTDDGASLPWSSLTPRLDPRPQIIPHRSQPQMTVQVPRLRIPSHKSQPQITLQKPQEDLEIMPLSLTKRRQKPQLREIQIREDILKVPRSSSLAAGTRILPPTPGPPPITELPKAPANTTLSPISVMLRSFSDIGPIRPTSYTSGTVGPPPSPMPPGFSEIKWPLPPTPALELSLDSIPTPTAESFRQVNPTPGSCPGPRLAKSPPVSIFPPCPETDRPRTVHGLTLAVPNKLTAAPQRHSRDMHHGGSKSDKRWASISGLIEPPLPSPGIDFGFCLSQPLYLVGEPSIPR